MIVLLRRWSWKASSPPGESSSGQYDSFTQKVVLDNGEECSALSFFMYPWSKSIFWEVELYESVELYSKDGLENAVSWWSWESNYAYSLLGLPGYRVHLVFDSFTQKWHRGTSWEMELTELIQEVYSEDGLEKTILWWHWERLCFAHSLFRYPKKHSC